MLRSRQTCTEHADCEDLDTENSGFSTMESYMESTAEDSWESKDRLECTYYEEEDEDHPDEDYDLDELQELWIWESEQVDEENGKQWRRKINLSRTFYVLVCTVLSILWRIRSAFNLPVFFTLFGLSMLFVYFDFSGQLSLRNRIFSFFLFRNRRYCARFLDSCKDRAVERVRRVSTRIRSASLA